MATRKGTHFAGSVQERVERGGGGGQRQREHAGKPLPLAACHHPPHPLLGIDCQDSSRENLCRCLWTGRTRLDAKALPHTTQLEQEPCNPLQDRAQEDDERHVCAGRRARVRAAKCGACRGGESLCTDHDAPLAMTHPTA
eukprot:954686-Rhodomonas_salina.1